MLVYLSKIYGTAALDATQRLKGSWPVLIGMLLLVVGFILINSIAAPLGILGGFLRGLAEAFAITYYLSWLQESSQYQRVRLGQLKVMDWSLFQSVISVLFILYLFQWGVTMLTTGIDARWAMNILQLLFVVLLNALPETLYLTRRDGLDGIQESFSFTTRNWIEWYIPFLIILSPMLLQSGASLPLILAQTHVLFPALAVVSVPSYFLPEIPLILLPLGLVLAHWFMLFRAKLYSELDSGSRNQRIFKSRM